MEDKVWKLPFDEELQSAIANDEVCVVGVFGKGTWGFNSKNLVINSAANTSCFMPHQFHYNLHNDGSIPVCDPSVFLPDIEGYYDKSNKVVYLHLTTMFDTASLASACAMLGNTFQTHCESHSFWKSQEIEIIFSLVYLFSVCHILVLVHPVATFDIKYEKIFHHVNNIRSKILPHVKDILKECTVGRDWWVNGRSCPPRLLFVMLKCHLSNLPQLDSNGMEMSSKKKKAPIQRLEHKLEDQIYKILRHSRVLTNNAVNCLFTVPPNQPFVHVMTEHYNQTKTEDDPVRSMLRLLRKSCETHRDPTARSRAYKLLTNPPTEWKDLEDSTSRSSVFAFLQQHIELVHEKKGFKDSVGRNPLPTHFEVPLFKNWQKVANNLHKLFFSQGSNSNDKKKAVDPSVFDKLSELKTHLLMHVDPEAHFSEARCSKLVSLASAAYQSNLPLHYTSKVHANQLAQAMANYLLHARGPAKEKYEQCVQAECEAFWNDGRRLCEVRSLTGRHCVHRFHHLPTDSKSKPDATPPVMYHSSRSRSLAASSCGRIQGSREDPFTLKDANYEFYQRLDARAPLLLPGDVYKFPVYIPEKHDKPSVVIPSDLHVFVEQLEINSDAASEVLTGEDAAKKSSSSQKNNEDSDDTMFTQESDHSDVKSAMRKRTTSSANFDFSLNSDSIAEVNTPDYQSEENLNQQQKFTETMVNSFTPEGVLPLFSSWSLVRIGSASMYNPSHGLDFTGFLPFTNYLVPWDIMCQTDETPAAHWPVPSEARKLSLKETKLSQRDSTARCFLGYEYETPRGQRFICSAPNKAVKATSNGTVRDSAQPLIDADMPIFTSSPVSGRSGKMGIGQLMRIYIVTPSEPSVHIIIKPQVVPGPAGTPVFHPSQSETVLRHNSVWVLRLPYVYVSDSGPHIPPKDLSQISSWCCMKMITVDIDQ